MTDLDNIINSWSKTTREHEINEVRKAVLDVFNKNRSHEFRLADVVKQVNMNEDLVAETITELKNRHFLYTQGYSAHIASFEINSNGIEVYESQHDIFSKIVIVMKNHQRHTITSPPHPPIPISTTDIAHKTNLSRYRITDFYMYKLVNFNPCIVIPRQGTTGRIVKGWLLTKTGEDLADYLISKSAAKA